MENLPIKELSHYFDQIPIVPIFRGSILILAGLLLARILSNAIGRLSKKYLEPQHHMLAIRSSYYLIVAIFTVSALREFGFSLEVLLGAAGIFSVAIGFASQTSASNLISGLFLIGERPFSVGDVIKTGDTMGEVLSIDLLSVKLRTYDNLFVRVPNETMLKSEVVNYSKFPIRRFDFIIGVAYKENIEKVKKVLLRVAEANVNCLDEPKPTFIFNDFGNSSIDIKFCAWARRENFLQLRNTILEDVKNAFDEEGIEIPFPHLSLYSGSVTDPFPIRIVPPEEKQQNES